jgi:hypothetical protein
VVALGSAYSCIYASDGAPTSTLQVLCGAVGPSPLPVYGWGVTLLATPLSAHCVQNFLGWGASILFYGGLEVGCGDPTLVSVPFVPGNSSCGTITNIYFIAPLGPSMSVDLFTTGGALLGTVTAASTTFPIAVC